MEETKVNLNSGVYYKDLGNERFKAGDYQAALDNYTKAIEIDDTQSVYFSNRSNCFKILKEFEKSNKDAVHAIELDDKNIKAHLLCGQTLVELGKNSKGTEEIELAISKMTKALTLCAGQKKKHYEKELTKYILRGRKVLWFKKQSILKDRKRQILVYIKGLLDKKIDLLNEEREEKFVSIKELIGDPEREIDFQIPDFLKCKLSGKLMDEPFTTQSGITYEKEDLFNFIKSNGCIDPCTRQIKINFKKINNFREPINEKMIYPNLNIKQAIESFLHENPWAFEFKPKENYTNIE